MSAIERVAPAERDPARAALAFVQVALGYEWLVSGLSKLHNGDFPGGLRGEFHDFAARAPSWYAGFLHHVVVAHAPAFGYLIEIGEVAVGVVLIGAAVAELAFGRLVQRLTFAALAAGIVMTANFELAHGGTFGLKLAADSFDEGVDLDTVMVAAQLALVVALAPALRRRRTNDT